MTASPSPEIRSTPPKAFLSPTVQLIIGVVIPISGGALDWFGGYHSAFERSGAVLVAFAVLCARFSLYFNDWVNHTITAATRSGVMKNGYQQDLFNMSLLADKARGDNDDVVLSAALEEANKLADRYNSLRPIDEENRKLFQKYSKLHSRALTVEFYLIVVGTLIWGFGDLVQIGQAA